MRYACLVYLDPTELFDGRPEHNALIDEANAEQDRLVNQGIVAEAFELPSGAVTVRVRNRKLRKTDGPFLESKEVLAGLVLIEAADMDAAVKMAETNPMAKIGAIEIRPMVDFAKPRPVL